MVYVASISDGLYTWNVLVGDNYNNEVPDCNVTSDDYNNELTFLEWEVYHTTQSPNKNNENDINKSVINWNGDDIKYVNSGTKILEPKEPNCVEGNHDWKEISTQGNGGGVIIEEACEYCDIYKITNTWATNPINGSQGHCTVEYVER